MTTDPYQQILSDLRAGAAERERAERELVEYDDAVENAPQYIEEKERQLLTEQYNEDLAAVQQNFSASRQELEARIRSENARIRDQHAQDVAEHNAQLDAEVARLEKKYQEDSWLVSSILDDKSEASPKWQLERLQAQLQKTEGTLAQERDELSLAYEQAVGLLEYRRQQIGPDPDSQVSAGTRESALQQFNEAALKVREESGRLSRQIIPRLFVGWIAVLSGLVFCGALATTIYASVDPASIGLSGRTWLEWVMISTGASIGVTCVVLLVLYIIAINQMHSVFDRLQQSWIDAESAFQTWKRLAHGDLQRAEQNYRSRYAAIVAHRDASLAKFGAERDRSAQALRIQNERDINAANLACELALRKAAEAHAQERQLGDDALRDEIKNLRTTFERELELRTREQTARQVERSARRDEIWHELVEGWTSTVARLEARSAELQERSRQTFSEWETIVSPDWKPSEGVPEGIRIGDYRVDLPAFFQSAAGVMVKNEDQTYLLPAMLTYPESPSLLLKANGLGKAAAVSILQVAMLRLLTQFRPGDVRFTIIDPVGLGENFAAFMHLGDYDDLLISSRIWTEPAHIENQLSLLTEHVENVFQKYLRNDFATIEEYNEHAGEVAEPYHFLIVANFPVGFTERAAQRLCSLAASGARCGIHTLMSVDTRLPPPRTFDVAELEASTNVLDWSDGRFLNPALGPEPVALQADVPPPAPLFASLIRKIGELSKHVRRVEVPFHRIIPRDDAWWTGDSRSLIEVPLGRAGATKLQFLRLGPGTSQHVLVAGKTGSGKSTLLHVIVTNLALRYSPSELEFYLIDFKKGVEFKTYATRQLPHARVISIESDREFGVSTLERLDAVLKERGDLFRDLGVQDIASFRNTRPDVRMPRILFIVDEFQEFFIEDDRYSQTAGLLLDRLVRQGRAFGIHVLLGSQTLGGAYSLARTTMGQMAVRIALQCSEADAHLILSEDNTAARLLTRPGEALYNDANGMLEGNSPFQIAWLNDDERDSCLDQVHSLAVERHEIFFDPIVFEGNVPANPLRNSALRRIVETRLTPPVVEIAGQEPQAWLGEAVAITGPTSVTFARRSGSNLLMVGQDAGSAWGILANSIAALTAQLPQIVTEVPPTADEPATKAAPAGMYLLSGDSNASNRKRLVELQQASPHGVTIVGSEQVAQTIIDIAAEVSTRQQTRSTAPPLFLCIEDLSRFRELRKSEDDYGFGSLDREKKPAIGQLFGDILPEGPAVGVHAIVWCDSYNNVDRWFSRQSLREFEMRVVFQMSASDSSNLIDSPAAAKLGPNRALLYSDERGTLEKFRPYGPPNEDWFAWLRSSNSENAPANEAEVVNDIDNWVVT